MIIQSRRLAPLVLAFGLAGTSCVNDLGHDPVGEPANLQIRAVITGLNTAATYSVNVQVTYQVTAGAPRPLEVDPSSFSVTAGGSANRHPVRVTLTPCLTDPNRLEAESGGCRLSVTLILTDETGELGQATQEIGLVQEGDQKSAETITITPNYQLDITGGGAGNGSGTVTVDAAGNQPAMVCQIINGEPATEGCSGRYPLHTPLVLTAVSGALVSWGGDCSSIAIGTTCGLTLDGHRRAEALFEVVPTTGELQVQIAGLREGVPAQVIVSNNSDFSQQVTVSTVLPNLEPGTYTVTATSVSDAGVTYTPGPERQEVTVAAGQRATAQIGYNAPRTGSLAIDIAGLPAETGAVVTVIGSDGNTRVVTRDTTLPGLTPGRYTITAIDVVTPDQIYAPTPTSQTRVVGETETAEALVTYAATTGRLTVIIAGLPAGVPAEVTVTGPDQYQQPLTATTAPPLLKLAPGSYTVAANSVTIGELLYEPTVTPRQPIQIRAGGDATVTVTYAVPSATRLVFVQQPTTTVMGQVITPPVRVEARDNQNRLVPGYATEITLTLQGDPGQDPSGGTLGGRTRAVPQGGAATFGDLTISRPQSGYTLVANSGTLAPDTSNAFTVTSGTPIITSVDFPDSVSNGPGTVVPASIGFSDPGGDITRLLISEIADTANTYNIQSFVVAAPVEGPAVVALNLWICPATSRGCRTGRVVLSLSLVDLEGTVGPATEVAFDVVGRPPVITAIDFPAEVPGDSGSRGSGTISFTDEDRDVVRAHFVTCSGLNCRTGSLAVEPATQIEGIKRFDLVCNMPSGCFGAEIDVQVVLEDFAGNRSSAAAFTFRYEDIPINAPRAQRHNPAIGLNLIIQPATNLPRAVAREP